MGLAGWYSSRLSATRSTVCWRARLHQKSALGAYLDPIADKFCFLPPSSCLPGKENRLVADHHGPQPRRSSVWWSPPSSSSIQGYRPFPPTLLGKATTFFEICPGLFLTVFAAAYPTTGPLLIHFLSASSSPSSSFPASTTAVVVARRLHNFLNPWQFCRPKTPASEGGRFTARRTVQRLGG